jgi:hypothetical protein
MINLLSARGYRIMRIASLVRNAAASLARGAANHPDQVLFDPGWESGLEGAIDPIRPVAFVGVAVTGVEDAYRIPGANGSTT